MSGTISESNGIQETPHQSTDPLPPSETFRVESYEPPRASMTNFYIIASAYIVYTFTDAALRMIVLFELYQRHYKPLEIALMFTSYEALGVVTNLFGGIMGSRWGLRPCILAGLMFQLIGISLLFVLLTSESWAKSAVIGYVVFAQAFAGVAKDLVKLAGKSVTKLVAKDDDAVNSPLFRIVAWVTGAKNSVKGLGFFMGATLLNFTGLWPSLLVLAILCLLVIPQCLRIDRNLGASKSTRPLTIREIFDKGFAVNMLSLARIFLFGSRDLWFEVVLPIYLRAMFGWSFTASGSFMAVWIIIYGAVQTVTPQYILRPLKCYPIKRGRILVPWTFVLVLVTIGLAAYQTTVRDVTDGSGSVGMLIALIIGLVVFAIFFAVNSSIHSYLIVAYAGKDKVAINVGFYYCANAIGRLVGTVLSGWLYQYYGIWLCLWVSTGFLVICGLISVYLPPIPGTTATPESK
ncbi:major facilitator superfamily-like protein [Phlyctochytrium arcticum]|nr:major facilitator superfamily-like protein [Phlyctochytrium arcticum]